MTRFEIDFLTDYGDEALLNELRRIAALVPTDQPLTRIVYKSSSPKVAESTITRRFGGWRQALEKAGLAHRYSGQSVSDKMKVQPARGWSDDLVLAELQRVYSLVGKQWLTSSDFNKYSNTSTESVRRRFGSFRQALERAGIPAAPQKARFFTNLECFENIADVWTQFGRPPEYREMFSASSKIQGKTYVLRWGTWRKALKAFVDWANSDSPAEAPERIKTSLDLPATTGAANAIEADCREVRPGLRFKVFMRDRFRCVACGRSPATSLEIQLHADHILPVAHGGKTTLDNLQTLCQDCNLGKGSALIPAPSVGRMSEA